MFTHLRHLTHDERGMSFVFIGLGFMAFFAATTLAVDVGMMMTARTQAQTSADSGALAGAVALALNNYDDRSASGPAVQSAISSAQKNAVMSNAVSIGPADVTFPLSPGGAADRVHVTVYRTGGRTNPVGTLIGPLFGVPTVDIVAAATAQAAPANAMTCVKPFIIPDRWTENQNPPWTTGSQFDRYNKKGIVIPNADVYVRAGQTGYKGYTASDKGMYLELRAGTGNNIEPTMYWSWDMPGASGGDWYRENIEHCNTTVVDYDDIVVQEPGNMVGPTNQGIDALIAQDPAAYWDNVTNSVHSTKNPSPRIFPIPLYDPDFYQSGIVSGRNATLRVANWIGFFVEGRNGNTVYGRINPILGVIDPDAGPAPDGLFPRAIRLVE